MAKEEQLTLRPPHRTAPHFLADRDSRTEKGGQGRLLSEEAERTFWSPSIRGRGSQPLQGPPRVPGHKPYVGTF